MTALRLATRPSPRRKTPWGAAPSPAPRGELATTGDTSPRAPTHVALLPRPLYTNPRQPPPSRLHRSPPHPPPPPLRRTHVAARLVERVRRRMSSSRLDTRTLKEEVASMDKRWLVDLGHPLVNRVADSFIRAAGVGAARAGLEGTRPGWTTPSRGAISREVKSAGKEAFQWGLAAGVYSGLTYGLREARGCHDWKNSAVAGAIAGVAVALMGDTGNADHMVHFAITGAALSSAASLLSGIY
uniref:Uncharacterized protein n=1 Tax=Oryza nivara TaxID=4536 RepID=A0A0E0FKQ1_ORYNI